MLFSCSQVGSGLGAEAADDARYSMRVVYGGRLGSELSADEVEELQLAGISTASFSRVWVEVYVGGDGVLDFKYREQDG